MNGKSFSFFQQTIAARKYRKGMKVNTKKIFRGIEQ